jgi:hypothetical protein
MSFNSPNVYYLENDDFDTQTYQLRTHLVNPRTQRTFFDGITIVISAVSVPDLNRYFNDLQMN